MQKMGNSKPSIQYLAYVEENPVELTIKMSFKLKHLTVEHSWSELVPSIQNFPASLHGNLTTHTSSIYFFDWELTVLN